MSVPSKENPNFVVQLQPGEYKSFLKSLKAFEKGQVIASLEGVTKAPKSYRTVQCGPGPEDHIELNSDFVYVNHSCEPNTAFDLSSPDSAGWHIRALRRIEAGDALGFFYPSTEWDMDQPFSCECGTKTCLGIIQGAKYLNKEDLLAHGWISPWILDLASQKNGQKSKTSAKMHSRL
ncbi:uncharacterized protein BT62DRAFT_934897 [Guyanagaster necrorhizus]|uniref:Post-SET domain-containing protein n=1 Tax=Guyanagaster necrorhizus TaxID=856835 RepID=A0A9P7VN84_9AGAR|nr:uncharacterized protein BT62DRAFT_934897 [Guyanagaster necrorhizus MCA 3950]KAG7443665.1 hypothetical protein BT62DRAFT_934897 [Guyanagaster necrorhizus MCA 3950]